MINIRFVVCLSCLKESGVKMLIYFVIFLLKGLYLNVGIKCC